tara:strand:+ start:800 stop:1861 length:1062 start_codon:yes stop_codon:yes gene_type:complete
MLNEFSKKEAPIQGLTGLGGGVPSRLLSAASGITVDEVFSTTLYAGSASAQTITNGIDLSGEGGMVWLKNRTGAYNHNLYDTERGVKKALYPNRTNSEYTENSSIGTFNDDGFTFAAGGDAAFNTSGSDFVSWTFRKCPKFFDVVTYTGDGQTNRNIPHNLGSVPGFIVVKGRNFGSDPWYSYHRYTGNQGELRLSESDSAVTGSSRWASFTPTSTYFRGDTAAINVLNRTYVAYLFAHDEQEFGTGGNEAIIKCGGFTMGSDTTISENLGFQPQWILFKRSSAQSPWWLVDTTRGVTSSSYKVLFPNTNDDEETKNYTGLYPTSTGFTFDNSNNGNWNAGGTFVYIAISDGT